GPGPVIGITARRRRDDGDGEVFLVLLVPPASFAPAVALLGGERAEAALDVPGSVVVRRMHPPRLRDRDWIDDVAFLDCHRRLGDTEGGDATLLVLTGSGPWLSAVRLLS